MIQAPAFNQTSFTALYELLAKRREHAAAIATIDGHLMDFAGGVALLVASQLPSLEDHFAAMKASAETEVTGDGAPVAPSAGPTLVDEGAFRKPVAHAELPEGAHLYETAPGVFLGVGPKGEQFSGALDSVLTALKSIAP